MFYNNHRFGINHVFADYLGIKDLVVPGEIQHGYWYSERWEKNRSSQFLFLKTFLWGGLFANKVRAQRPDKFETIGDPFLYANLKPLNTFLTPNKESWVLYPQFSSNLPTKQREAKHIDFLDWVNSNGINQGSISFHPNEKISSELMVHFKNRGFELIDPIAVGDPEFLEKKRAELLSHSGVITNYLGPHLFRATLLGRLALIDNRIDLEDFKLEYQQVIQPFLMMNNYQARADYRLEIAHRELGLSFLRSQDFLLHLFFTDKRSQFSLKILQNSKNLISGMKSITESTPIEIDPSNSSFWECPHCFSRKRLFKAKFLNYVCKNCYRRFQIRQENYALDDRL